MPSITSSSICYQSKIILKMNISCIYKIRNLLNNKVYIGSAINFYQRKRIHINDLKGNRHHSNHLQNSWNKNGEFNFIFEIIEEVDPEKLIEREQFYIDKNKSYNGLYGYNISPTAGSQLGFRHSKETKDKLSKLQFGKSYVQKLGSEEKTKELIEKIRSKNTGKVRSEEIKKKFQGKNNAFYGKEHSIESKLKISKACTGKVPPNKGKIILKFDLQNNFIEQTTLDKISLNTKPNVVKCCRGERHKADGFIWKYKDSIE
jgi:group I intron endonuclease